PPPYGLLDLPADRVERAGNDLHDPVSRRASSAAATESIDIPPALLGNEDLEHPRWNLGERGRRRDLTAVAPPWYGSRIDPLLPPLCRRAFLHWLGPSGPARLNLALFAAALAQGRQRRGRAPTKTTRRRRAGRRKVADTGTGARRS